MHALPSWSESTCEAQFRCAPSLTSYISAIEQVGQVRTGQGRKMASCVQSRCSSPCWYNARQHFAVNQADMWFADENEPQARSMPPGLVTSLSLPTADTRTASTMPVQQLARQTSANVPVTGRTGDQASVSPSRPALQQPARRAPNDAGANDEQVNASVTCHRVHGCQRVC